MEIELVTNRPKTGRAKNVKGKTRRSRMEEREKKPDERQAQNVDQSR
jgi:hypothetical protein